MVKEQTAPDRPMRVVMFGGGPVLETDVKQFLVRLEAHPEIRLLAAFCQSQGQTFADVARDLWRRRRLLAGPLLALQMLERLRKAATWGGGDRELERQLARIAGRIHFVPDIHDDAVLDRVRALKPELGLVYGSPILKPALFEIPAQGTLGIHHGQLPQYRGKKTTFWAMYNGEAEAAVTIQKINAGLDTGQIVNSDTVPIGRRSYGAVWRELLALGLDLYIESILQVKAGTAVYRPQKGAKGKLYSDPNPRDLLRFWQRQLRRRLTSG